MKFKVTKLEAVENEIKALEPAQQELLKSEYAKKSGLAAYEKEFGHGGARENAGRKQKFKQPLKFQIRVTQEEKDFINYAREHHLSYSAMMK